MMYVAKVIAWAIPMALLARLLVPGVHDDWRLWLLVIASGLLDDFVEWMFKVAGK